jgi:hypothetical protein
VEVSKVGRKKRDEYDIIYNYDIEDSRNYEELYEDEDPEEVIERLRGTIASGDCVYCGGKNTMEYVGDICFVCSKCGMSVHEDVYYRWAAGYDLEFED